MRVAVLRPIVVGVIAASLLVAPRVARADTLDADACATHAENGQRERAAGHIESARDELAECSKAECPDIVRRDCERWFVETGASSTSGAGPSPSPAPRPPGPEPASVPAETAAPTSASTAGAIVGWSLVGVGAVSTGLGLYFGLKTFSSPCAGSGVCTADERDSASTAGAVSAAGFIGGLALVAGGIIVLLSR